MELVRLAQRAGRHLRRGASPPVVRPGGTRAPPCSTSGCGRMGAQRRAAASGARPTGCPRPTWSSCADGATVNQGCVVQTHLFHDRVLSMDPVTLRRGRDARAQQRDPAGGSDRAARYGRPGVAGDAGRVRAGQDPLDRQPDRPLGSTRRRTREPRARSGVDDYLPGHGDLVVRRQPLRPRPRLRGRDGNRLDGRGDAELPWPRRATDRVVLDLHGLRVAKVTVRRRPPVRVPDRAGPARRAGSGTRSRAGQEFRVRSATGARPRPCHGTVGEAGWEELTDGVIVAAQPHGAPSWFPCNDRPGNKATYRSRSTDVGATTSSPTGALVDQRRGASRTTTWVYEQRRADGDLPRDRPDRPLRACVARPAPVPRAAVADRPPRRGTRSTRRSAGSPR